MDELIELRLAGLENTRPDPHAREHVRTALRAHVAAQRRARIRRRAGLALAVLLFGGLLLAATVGARIYNAFFGHPAPLRLQRALVTFTRQNRVLPPEMRAPGFVISKTRGLLQVRTPAGLVDLWEVPVRTGGTCTFAQADARAPRKLRAPAPGPCSIRGMAQSPVLWSAVNVRVGGSPVRMLEGHVAPGIDRLELRLPDSRTSLALAHGYFLAPIPVGVEGAQLLARKHGHVVARVDVVPTALGRSFGGEPPLQRAFLRAGMVLEVTAPAGPVFLAIDHGQRCAGLYDYPGWALVCPRSGRRLQYTISIASGAVIAAYAGAGAARLDLELEDGSSRRLPLVRGWALHVIATLPDPKALVARRADGSVIERLPIVWF
jgi:hypothetical protein